MHRIRARAHYYKSLPQNDSDGDSEGSDENGPPTLCQQIKRKLPDSDSTAFNIVVGVVICLNAVVLGLETDFGQEYFVVFEHFFGVFFTGEMFLRITQCGCLGYVSKASNCFDCLLVVTGDFDLWISPFLHASKGSSSQLLKLLRLFRVMRIIRLFKMFHELQIILEAFVKALHTVMWVGLLTLILNYIVAVFVTQTIGHNADMWDAEDEADIKLWFGNIGCSMRTLFIIITLAEWDIIALVVAKRVNGFIVFVLAIAYITLTAFTMVSLITGIISEELVGAQRDDESHKLQQIEKKKSELAHTVEEMLKSFDADSSGFLSDEEVKTALNSVDLKFLERLQALDINMEMDDFLALIARLKKASGTEEVAIDVVVQALKHLSGGASSSSVWDVKMHILQIQKDNRHATSALEQAGTDVVALTDEVAKQSSETCAKVNQVIASISNLDEKAKSATARMDENLTKLTEGLLRLDDQVQEQKAKTDQRVIDRLTKLEEMLHVLSNHVAKGVMASTAGTGESMAAGTGESTATGSDGAAAYVTQDGGVEGDPSNCTQH